MKSAELKKIKLNQELVKKIQKAVLDKTKNEQDVNTNLQQ